MNPRVWAAAVVVFLLNLAINWRILLPGVSPYRGSIERGYAYMARLFADNPDYLSWNPLQYGGIPLHYVYLPLLPYFDALWLWVPAAVPPADRDEKMFTHPDLRHWLPSERLVAGNDSGGTLCCQ